MTVCACDYMHMTVCAHDYMCMTPYVHMTVCAHDWGYSQRLEKDTKSPGTGVVGDVSYPKSVTETRLWSCKSSKCSILLYHLLTSDLFFDKLVYLLLLKISIFPLCTHISFAVCNNPYNTLSNIPCIYAMFCFAYPDKHFHLCNSSHFPCSMYSKYLGVGRCRPWDL